MRSIQEAHVDLGIPLRHRHELQAMCSKADGNTGLVHVYIMPHVHKPLLAPATSTHLDTQDPAAWQIPAISQHLHTNTQVSQLVILD